MNLNAYDSITPNFTTTWIVPSNKKLYSYTIPFYKYYTFLKRYDNKAKVNDYFIAFSNNQTNDRKWYNVYRTKSNAIKIDLSYIWNVTNLFKLTYNQEINVKIDSEFDDGVVYYLDV